MSRFFDQLLRDPAAAQATTACRSGKKQCRFRSRTKASSFGLLRKSSFAKASVPLFEHAARRTGSRDEFNEPFCPEGLFVNLKQVLFFRCGEDNDPVSRMAGTVQADRRDAPPEESQLLFPPPRRSIPPRRSVPGPLQTTSFQYDSLLLFLPLFSDFFRRRNLLLFPKKPGDILLSAGDLSFRHRP